MADVPDDAADSELGAFLKARRGRLDPTDVGLPRGRRRTPGLRREEVAARAGVSVDYLARLEQGRSERPSAEVLDALARALRLDADAHRHLRLLAGVAPPLTSTDGPLRLDLVAVIGTLAPAPAYLLSRTMDVITATPAARALLGPFGRPDQPNVVRSMFTEPETRAYVGNWEEAALDMVAHLRSAVGMADPAAVALVEELSAASDEFAAAWARHDVAPCAFGLKYHRHPSVGEFTLAYESFLAGDHTAALVLLVPAGDERSRTAFELLTRVALDPA